MGVPEVWRCDGQRVAIFRLEGQGYVGVTASAVLPPHTGDRLSRFVEESKSLRRVAWLRMVREWAREHGQTADPSR